MPRGIVEYLAVCVNSDGGGSRIDPAARGERGMVLDGVYAKRVCIIRILTQRYLSRVKLIDLVMEHRSRMTKLMKTFI